MRLKDFDYHLPKHLLAQKPAVPRDRSRLFIYNTASDKIVFDRFYHLDKYLPANSFLVLNNTKVIPARVVLTKAGGGKVITLLLINELIEPQVVKALVDRQVKIGERLFIDKTHFFDVINQNEKIFFLKFNFRRGWLLKKLSAIGKTPVPLYLRKSPLEESVLRQKYQTIFAVNKVNRFGSIAAPTASLHFTNRVFNRLEKKGVDKFFITLHVGLGTFAPITEDNLKSKKLHEEYYEVDNKSLQCFEALKSEGKKLVAVGTTVVRTLESEARQRVFSSTSPPKGGSPKSLTQKQLSSLQKTNLFIYPPYDFKMVDILITNFHLPQSSLMMLVEAFLQFKGAKKNLLQLYNIVIKNNFRFYSFGDAMVIV